jgi:hypothetical protein
LRIAATPIWKNSIDVYGEWREMTPEELMREVVAAFEKADLQPLLAAIEDDTAWSSASTIQGKVCFGREYKNRAGLIETISHISEAYYFWHRKKSYRKARLSGANSRSKRTTSPLISVDNDLNILI